MQREELTASFSKASALMEHFQPNCQRVEQNLHATAKQLDALSKQVPHQVQHSVDNMLGTLPSQIVGQVGQRLNPSVESFERRLEQSGQVMQQGIHAIHEALQAVQHLHQRLIWKVLSVTLLCLVLLIGGGVWLSSYYLGTINQNRLTAEWMQAYHNADIAPCGTQLCANVDKAAPKYGDKGQYMQIKLRQ